MQPSTAPCAADPGGIRILSSGPDSLAAARQFLQARGLDGHALAEAGADGAVLIRARADFAARHLPDGDTTGLVASLGLDPSQDADLEQEIVLAMLACPVAFPFPDVAELEAAVRIRRNIVRAATRSALAFDTEQAERPAGYWTYDESTGFTILPGRSLIEGLTLATQPEVSGQTYAFSCYRATEYVTVLGIAQELQRSNPELHDRLQRQWETRAVMSGRFHDAFLREYGSLDAPLPPRFYVPGDRLWFRNPDAHSSNVEGYEGSWVFYLGSGLFNNFWKRDQPYTLTHKCLEIFHWRDGARLNAEGKLFIDEDIVEARVAQTEADPAARQAVLERMLRIRDPQGVYAEGGCIDATRECARWVLPGHADIALPEFPQAPA
ncbi:hypothetical protein [Bordetella genomosp. 12]|uniref:Uncharacterized protein n=1 Tax=Bordetella genomosp. 12 TaxID=463035 RepID=A0A261VLM8_9BORD|nr:hypothetical protein [Bordetella genomosp. 12]OZI75024.1 hypothetical protein CAL22_11460 [Bordetella genomosp. 12]